MNLNQEELDELEKQIRINPLTKQPNLPTQLLNELLGEEQKSLELNIGLGKREIKATVHIDEDTNVNIGVGFKNEIKVNGSITKKF